MTARRSTSEPERTAFFGRTRDIAAVVAALSEGRSLITLIGPPGIGKTRLARRAGLRWHEETQQEVSFVDATQARSASDLVATVARALSIPLTNAAELERAIAAMGEVLIILDNFEQVVGAASETVGRWLAAAPLATILVTSREALRLEGELRYELTPLDDNDAVALLEDRARLVRSRAVPLDNGKVSALEIVQRLEGNPLAIELAAARLGALSSAQLLERTSAQLELLRSDRRDASARHITMRDAISGSWDALTAPERAALAQSAVFCGGFTIEAAESVLVCGPAPTSVLELLEALRAKSLLTLRGVDDRGDTVRFSSYACIREYADEMLDASSRAAAEARHEAYYLAHAERLAACEHGPLEAQALDTLSVEFDNIVAAFRRSSQRNRAAAAARLALALQPLLSTRGPFDMQLELAEAAERWASNCEEELLHARGLLAHGEALSARGRLDDADGALRTAREKARGLGAASIEARALATLAANDRVKGRHTEAMTHATAALEVARSARDEISEGLALTAIGLAHQSAGELKLAKQFHEDALAVHRRCKNVRFESIALGRLGNIAYQEGRLEKAVASFRASLQIHGELGDRRYEAIQLTNLGGILHDLHDLPAAGDCLERAIAISAEVGDEATEGVASTFLGALLLERGDSSAAAILMRSRFLHRKVDNPRFESLASRYLGQLSCAAGALDEAHSHYGRAVALAERAGYADGEGLALAHLAFSEWLRSNDAVADATFARALTALERSSDARSATVVRVLRDAAAARDPSPKPASAHVEADHAARSGDARLAAQLVSDTLTGIWRTVCPEEPALVVDRQGRWFNRVGAPRVAMGRRIAMRRILVSLVEQHFACPGEEKTAVELVSIGWPGERVMPDAANRRVRTAIWELRRLGLGDILRTQAVGYVIDPRIAVAWAKPARAPSLTEA